MPRALSLALLCIGVALSSGASAQTPEDEARALAIEAKSAFDAGEFREAAKLLEQAYTINPSSALLYNLGRAYQQTGDKARAVDAYQRYLESETDPADEGAVRRTVQQLQAEMARERALAKRLARERARADREAEERRATQAAQEARERDRHKPSALPWIVTGVGVSMLATGGVLGVLARTKHDAAVAKADANTARDEQDAATRLATWTNVTFVVGGVTTLTGVIWGWLDLRGANTKPKTSLVIGPGMLGVRGEL